MKDMLRSIRRGAGAARRWLAPAPDVAAWRHACRVAATTPRFTPGDIQLGPYSLRYSDLLTLCPQWRDIFVAGSLAFETANPSPRILDCGANIGLASLFFKRRYPAARITALAGAPATEAIRVPTIRLAERLAAEPIDLLKLDIEGAESVVLADCAAALDNVAAVILEVHEFDPAK